MAYYEARINRIFVTHERRNCWAHLQGVGWRKVDPRNTDGVTNMHAALVTARSMGVTIPIRTDDDDQMILRIYV